ncbi:chromosome segregation protein SMC, partial [Propionibacterium freudenreichii]|nr:chromosome segregation protein SMC [Propionibacterium freudenreichii]
RDDLGRAGLVIQGAPDAQPSSGPVPAGTRRVRDLVQVPQPMAPAVNELLGEFLAVEDLDEAFAVVSGDPQLQVVTRRGELLSAWFMAGGSGSGRSRIELQAAISSTREELSTARHEAERAHFSRQQAGEAVSAAQKKADAALELLNESDAAMSALSEQISHLGQASATARAEAERATASIDKANSRRAADEGELGALRQRLELARSQEEVAEPDPARRDELSV